ncbi:hypothetical protein VIGAN_10221400 [Vigna angularis var. angularis]|uniref:Uncharacterized protein n=1 Tax=Vigna angularis var. angularis TaxID=157739 RepID=A0A0S3T6Z4_PHAAN|nr:hypothetical protein VIGAN_10221400 [Vigna angularis var. angularis]
MHQRSRPSTICFALFLHSSSHKPWNRCHFAGENHIDSTPKSKQSIAPVKFVAIPGFSPEIKTALVAGNSDLGEPRRWRATELVKWVRQRPRGVARRLSTSLLVE